MKKFYVLGLTLAAVCAIGVISAVSASALTFLLAEWLESGTGITATLLAEGAGEIGLGETLDGVHIDVLCSGVGVGFIGPDGTDEITEGLSLSGEKISSVGLTGSALTCTNSGDCGVPLVWSVGLPWLSVLVLMEDGTEAFFADLTTGTKGSTPGYEVECMSLGIADTCTAPESVVKIENTAEGLDAETSVPFTELAGLKRGNCEVAGTEAATLEGLGFISVLGVTLTASE